jgi:DNA-binding NarL/FixJ family response regulator
MKTTPERKLVVVVDDHIAITDKVKALLQSEYEVECANTYDHALDLLKRKNVHIAIVDLRLDQVDGVERLGLDLIDEVRRAKGTDLITRFIVFSQYGQSQFLRGILQRRVLGFLTKAEMNLMPECIAFVLQGEDYLSPRLGRDLARELRDTTIPASSFKASPTQPNHQLWEDFDFKFKRPAYNAFFDVLNNEDDILKPEMRSELTSFLESHLEQDRDAETFLRANDFMVRFLSLTRLERFVAIGLGSELPKHLLGAYVRGDSLRKHKAAAAKGLNLDDDRLTKQYLKEHVRQIPNAFILDLLGDVLEDLRQRIQDK